MSEYANIPQVTTLPKPFGVTVKWKWPDGSHWFSGLELQCLFEDGRFEKERICWPVTEKLISGLKASERVQVRLRPVAADGSARDWRTGDWIEGISSVDTVEILQALQYEIRSYGSLEGLKRGWFVDKAGLAYIHKALIGDGVLPQNYSVKMSINNDGKEHVAGMAVTVEDAQRKVVFKADNFKPHEAAQSTSNNEERALNGGLDFGGFPGTISHVHDGRSNATKTILTDEMREAIISAVRESDLFTSLQTAIAAQEASISGLKQAVDDAVGDAIRNSLRPGGAIWNNLGSR
ncbi:DUF1983 domain-containing protein [Enterobacter soli]|uniref:phage tail tip fiber protein n=1 Tax=Enterobacter soli TaxID=885040 RepID=UPI002F3FE934